MAHNQVVVIGAHVQCYVNAQLIGRVSSFSLNSTTGYRAARGIDIPIVQEMIPTIHEVSFSLGLIRTAGDGGAQGIGLTPQAPDLSLFKYFTVLLLDRRTDLPVFKADFCVTTSESWQLDARARMVGSVTCQGILWGNESNSH